MYNYSIDWNPERVIKITETKMETVLDRVCADSIREIKLDMQSPKHGIPVGKRKGILAPRKKREDAQISVKFSSSQPRRNKQYRTRSAPGEAPAIQLGVLVDSLLSTKPGPLSRKIGVTNEAYYGEFLEPNTGKGLQNRPFLLKNVVKSFQKWLDKQK